MDKSLKAPRALTSDEVSSLRSLLESTLKINSETDKEDAENLLDYAFDMIETEEAVGHIAEEVRFFSLWIYCICVIYVYKMGQCTDIY
jgi:dTDP-D-glucose 4,6-dehydratase